MEELRSLVPLVTARRPWNKGKLIGPKPPLRFKHVWSIRTKLQLKGCKRDLALFNLAIDSKLRGCDIVAIKVEDVAPNGYAIDRATVRQKRLANRCDLKFQNRLGKHWTTTFARKVGREVTFYSEAGKVHRVAFPPGNMPAWY